MFQYPLFRIELLSTEAEKAIAEAYEFQYPLFRIELLSIEKAAHKHGAKPVSISALSDRIAQH